MILREGTEEGLVQDCKSFILGMKMQAESGQPTYPRVGSADQQAHSGPNLGSP